MPALMMLGRASEGDKLYGLSFSSGMLRWAPTASQMLLGMMVGIYVNGRYVASAPVSVGSARLTASDADLIQAFLFADGDWIPDESPSGWADAIITGQAEINGFVLHAAESFVDSFSIDGSDYRAIHVPEYSAGQAYRIRKSELKLSTGLYQVRQQSGYWILELIDDIMHPSPTVTTIQDNQPVVSDSNIFACGLEVKGSGTDQFQVTEGAQFTVRNPSGGSKTIQITAHPTHPDSIVLIDSITVTTNRELARSLITVALDADMSKITFTAPAGYNVEVASNLDSLWAYGWKDIPDCVDWLAMKSGQSVQYVLPLSDTVARFAYRAVDSSSGFRTDWINGIDVKCPMVRDSILEIGSLYADTDELFGGVPFISIKLQKPASVWTGILGSLSYDASVTTKYGEIIRDNEVISEFMQHRQQEGGFTFDTWRAYSNNRGVTDPMTYALPVLSYPCIEGSVIILDGTVNVSLTYNLLQQLISGDTITNSFTISKSAKLSWGEVDSYAEAHAW